MREILVDHARMRAADKRVPDRQRVPLLDEWIGYLRQQDLDVLDLHEALERLAQLDERQSEVVTLRFFVGLTVPDVAEQRGVSVSTVENDWRLARAWLRRQLRKGKA
jgi:RNA polymerase sigma factor (TIGR02999 family)